MLRQSTQSIQFIFMELACVCGFLEAKNSAVAMDSEAGKVLLSEGLWEWQALFAKDLRRHYENRHRWSSDAELFQFAGHVERFLWKIGVIVTQTGGEPWIDVLNDEQMSRVGLLLNS